LHDQRFVSTAIRRRWRVRPARLSFVRWAMQTITIKIDARWLLLLLAVFYFIFINFLTNEAHKYVPKAKEHIYALLQAEMIRKTEELSIEKMEKVLNVEIVSFSFRLGLFGGANFRIEYKVNGKVPENNPVRYYRLEYDFFFGEWKEWEKQILHKSSISSIKWRLSPWKIV
jgi:hypothetical protein